LLSMRTAFTPFSGVDRLLISFEVVIVGGLGSLWGALAGGLLLGVVQMAGLRIAPESGLLPVHIAFFVVLLR
jgi:branched-chain amino acid transport system permease protein